jgi:hypothetical protein
LISCKSRLITLFLILAAATALHAQAPQVVAVRAGRLFTSKPGKAAEHQVILVEGEKITAVGSADSVQIPAGATAIDLSKDDNSTGGKYSREACVRKAAVWQSPAASRFHSTPEWDRFRTYRRLWSFPAWLNTA